MPTFDFKCNLCGYQFSELVSLNDKSKVRCPKCGGPVSQRFTGFMYIGSDGSGSSGSSGCSGGNCNTCGGCH